MNNVVEAHCAPSCDNLDADALLRSSRETLATVDEALRATDDDSRIISQVEELEAAEYALQAAERLVRQQLWRIPGATSAPVLTSHLVQVQSLRLLISEARLHARSVTTTEVHRSLQRLSGLSITALLDQIPVELGGIGFSRSLLSVLRGTRWSAKTAFAHNDVSLADALVKVGKEVPGRIGREEPETKIYHQRLPALVRDAQSKPYVHRDLITLADTRDYAAAPIVVNGTVIALLHVDRHSQFDLLDSFDRELLGLFSEGAGLAFERARYHARFAALKQQFERQINDVDELVYGTDEWCPDAEDSTPGVETAGQTGSSIPHPFLSDGPLGELTRREFEVLRHLAGGASNQDIAARLVVSTGTVKTHIKHLLRKLGAADRTDAAAKFHRLTRPGDH